MYGCEEEYRQKHHTQHALHIPSREVKPRGPRNLPHRKTEALESRFYLPEGQPPAAVRIQSRKGLSKVHVGHSFVMILTKVIRLRQAESETHFPREPPQGRLRGALRPVIHRMNILVGGWGKSVVEKRRTNGVSSLWRLHPDQILSPIKQTSFFAHCTKNVRRLRSWPSLWQIKEEVHVCAHASKRVLRG